jgi:hypothetical protein
MKLPSAKIDVFTALSKGQALDLPLSEILALLNCKLPDCWVSFKPTFSKGQAKQKVPYISWTDITLILDYVTNHNWIADYEISQIGDYVTFTCRLSITGNDGRTKSTVSVGNEPLSSGDHFGGPVCDAQAMALRRAAATLGLGRYLYYPNLTSPTSNQNPPHREKEIYNKRVEASCISE